MLEAGKVSIFRIKMLHGRTKIKKALLPPIREKVV